MNRNKDENQVIISVNEEKSFHKFPYSEDEMVVGCKLTPHFCISMNQK
jgi:hypothetical protein